jgi:ABC-type lipoprotein release transport system permease subunit
MMWIEKQRNIIDFTLSSLLRRKRKNAALAVVYTLVVFALASVMFFTHAIRKEAAVVLKDAPELIVQRQIAGRQELIPLSYIEKIKSIGGVISVRGRLWGYYYDPMFGANYTVMVPEEFPHEANEVIVGSGLTRSSLASEGSIIPLRSSKGELVSFVIMEILPSDSEIVSSDLILMSEDGFRRLYEIPPGRVTDLVLKVRNQKELSTIATKITKLLPDTRPIIRDEILRTYDAVFNWRGGLMMLILFGAVLAFIIFAWDKASGLSAEEKREIGILKAIGWETSDVILMKFWEGTALSLTSFLLGLLLAYGHVFLFSSALFEPALKGWAVLYPSFRLVPYVDPFQISTLFFLTVIPYTVATIIPSWRAATVDPDSVMRT